MVDVVALDDRHAAMLAWLSSDDARSAARADLRRHGLDRYEPEDLLHDVAVRLLRATLPEVVANPVAYARRAVQLRSTDLLRGDRLRAAEPLDDLPVEPAGDREDLDDVVVAASTEDAIRRALHAALVRTKAWAVAAALGTLTLRLHPDVQVPPAAPRPEADTADGDKADRWAALWLAGETDAFADGAAARQARSRKLREVERLLRTVAASVLAAGR